MALFSFDLDDTLVKSSDEVFEAFNRTLKANGMEPVSHESYQEFQIWKEGKWNTDGLGIDMTHQEFQEKFDAHYHDTTREYLQNGRIRLFQGARDILKNVRRDGHKTALVTNSPRRTTKLKLEHFDLAKYFDSMMMPEDHGRKPSPEGIRAAIRETGQEKERSVHIGDSTLDIDAAKNAGITSVAVTDEEEKQRLADHSITHIRELESIKNQIHGRFI